MAETNVAGSRAVLAVPRTFMNESGQAVVPLLKYYGIDSDRLLVVHDDIDVPLGKIKVQHGGGHGGNNGVRSVMGSPGPEEFWRLKIGVGRPPNQMDAADYVLGRFGASERDTVDVAVYRAADVVESFITDGGDRARQFAGGIERLGDSRLGGAGGRIRWGDRSRYNELSVLDCRCFGCCRW